MGGAASSSGGCGPVQIITCGLVSSEPYREYNEQAVLIYNCDQGLRAALVRGLDVLKEPYLDENDLKGVILWKMRLPERLELAPIHAQPFNVKEEIKEDLINGLNNKIVASLCRFRLYDCRADDNDNERNLDVSARTVPPTPNHCIICSLLDPCGTLYLILTWSDRINRGHRSPGQHSPPRLVSLGLHSTSKQSLKRNNFKLFKITSNLSKERKALKLKGKKWLRLKSFPP